MRVGASSLFYLRSWCFARLELYDCGQFGDEATARFEKDNDYVEAENVPIDRLEAALNAAIEAFGDVNRWESAVCAYVLETTKTDRDSERSRARPWWNASGSA